MVMTLVLADLLNQHCSQRKGRSSRGQEGGKGHLSSSPVTHNYSKYLVMTCCSLIGPPAAKENEKTSIG